MTIKDKIKARRNKIMNTSRANIIINIASVMLLLLLSVFNVYALGISPSKKIIDYDTSEHIITSSVINNEGRDVTIKITANGPLSEYVNILDPVLNIRSSESEKEFRYSVQMPDNLDPGPKMTYVTISEISNELENNVVGGVLTLTQQLQINVPYTGLYAEGYLTIDSSTVNKPINTMIEILNRGDENIQSITATLNIVDANDRTVYTKIIADYKTMEIAPKESLKIEEEVLLNGTGTYTAQYNIVYNNENFGDKNFIVTKEFDLGEYEINVLGAGVTNFKLGTVAKFNINLAAKWNKPINDVFGTITIKDKNNATVGETNITKTTINPEVNSLTAYVDTANIKSGNYTIGIRLYAGSKVITKEYPTTIAEDEITIGMKSETKSVEKSYTWVVVLILAVFGIVTLLVMLEKNKKLYK